MRHITLLYIAIFSSTLFWSCNDSSVVGLDLVEDNQLNIQFADDIPFSLTTVLSEPIETYKSELGDIETINTLLLGQLTDPTFGTTSASLYGQVVLDLVPAPGLENGDLQADSIILVLPYAPDGFYGDTTEEVTIEVYELLEQLDEDTDYTAEAEPLIDESSPLATFQVTPSPNTTKTLIGYRTGEAREIRRRYLRVPLDVSLGQRFLELDTSVLRDDALFLDAFKGLHIRMTNADNTLLGIDFSREENRAGIDAGLSFYYNIADADEDDVPFEYFFPFTPLSRYPTVKFPTFEHEYSNTPIARTLGDKTAERVYIQGGNGVDIKLTLPDLSVLEGNIINQAKLELPIIQIGDAVNPNFPPPEQLLLFKEGDNGDLELINDFEIGILSVGESSAAAAVGGALMPLARDTSILGYTLLLSDQLQRIVDGEADNELLIRVASPINLSFRFRQDATKGKRVNWSILGSDNNPDEQFRARFMVTYTEVN